jgi:hypothetical protein
MVIHLKHFLAALAPQPLPRMIPAPRCRLAGTPSAWSHRVIPGQPGRLFSSSKMRLMALASPRLACFLSESGRCLQR